MSEMRLCASVSKRKRKASTNTRSIVCGQQFGCKINGSTDVFTPAHNSLQVENNNSNIETQPGIWPTTQIRRRATKVINWTLVSIWVALPAELGWVSSRFVYLVSCLSFCCVSKTFTRRAVCLWPQIQYNRNKTQNY